MFSSLNAPFIGISQLRRIVLQIEWNGMECVKQQTKMGCASDRIKDLRGGMRFARARRLWRPQRVRLFLGAIGPSDCDWKRIGERRAGYAFLGDYGGDVAVGSHVEGDVGGADVWRRAYAR